MANWKYRLNFVELWRAYKDKKIRASELGKKVAEVIRNAPFFEAEKENLESIAEEMSEVEDIEEFDNVLETLYEWGDERTDTKPLPWGTYQCWVQTF